MKNKKVKSALYHSPDYLTSIKSIGLLVQKKKRKIDFKDEEHLGFLIGMILAVFDLQVTLILPTKFGVNWPFGPGDEGQNRFSRWPPWPPSWISDQNELSYIRSIKFRVNWPFYSGEVQIRFLRWRLWQPLDLQNNFSNFWSTSHPDTSY